MITHVLFEFSLLIDQVGLFCSDSGIQSQGQMFSPMTPFLFCKKVDFVHFWDEWGREAAPAAVIYLFDQIVPKVFLQKKKKKNYNISDSRIETEKRWTEERGVEYFWYSRDGSIIFSQFSWKSLLDFVLRKPGGRGRSDWLLFSSTAVVLILTHRRYTMCYLDNQNCSGNFRCLSSRLIPSSEDVHDCTKPSQKCNLLPDNLFAKRKQKVLFLASASWKK